MDNKQTPLKQQLPFPYNQDLSKVVRHLNRSSEVSRARLANDPVTAAYLAAGMRLVRRHLGPGAERKLADAEDADSVERPLLAFASQRAVASEVANNPQPFPQAGSVSTLRSTWRTHSDFIADLLCFGLWSSQYPVTQDNEERAAYAEELITGKDIVQAVHDLAYWDSATTIGLPLSRLDLIAAVAAEGDTVITKAIAEGNRGALQPWKQLYADFIQARGLRLRPGFTIDDIAILLSACAQGLMTHAIGDPGLKIIDHTSRRSLLGTAALAIIYACMERVENPTGLNLDQAVRAMLCDSPGSSTKPECP